MNKRNTCSQIAARSGVLPLLERLARRDALLVFNYHRIGDAGSTALDSGVYSATTAEFEWQMRYLRKRFSILSLDEVNELADGWGKARGPRVLITFDDGYKDNYELAFPILRALGVPAVFFLVSSYLDNPRIPWWDKIAYWVRSSQRTSLRINYPKARELPLPAGQRRETIRTLLKLFKSQVTQDPERFLRELEAECGPVPALPEAASLFVNRSEAREMIAGGMAIGSHTRSHAILSKLEPAAQLAELVESKTILSRECGTEVTALAFPVGGRKDFTPVTCELAAKAGYRTAYSFYGGLNGRAGFNPFDIKRVDVETGNPPSRFRLQTSLAIQSNGYWF